MKGQQIQKGKSPKMTPVILIWEVAEKLYFFR